MSSTLREVLLKLDGVSSECENQLIFSLPRSTQGEGLGKEHNREEKWTFGCHYYS